VGAPGGGDLTQPLGAGREEGAETGTVDAFKAPEPAKAAPEVLETKSLAVLPDLPKPANPDVVETKAEAKAVAAEDRKPDVRKSAKRLVAKRDNAVKKAKGEAKASARSEGKSKATPAAIKTAAIKTAAGKTAEKTAAKKTATRKSKGGR
jgi:hypothetical protein